MKLVSFSPWKHTSTSIPCVDGGEDEIIQQFIVSPLSSSLSSSPSTLKKRINSSSSTLSPSSLDMQPIMTLVSHHRLCILGRSDPMSRKLLTDNSGAAANATAADDRSSSTVILNQVPQWIYSSRPGDASSLFPNGHSSKKQPSKLDNGNVNRSRAVGAVVDPTSRSIFVLQNDNRTMKVWGLDDDVNGPDDETGNTTNTNSRAVFQNGTHTSNKSKSKSKSNGVGNTKSSKSTTSSSSSSLIQKVEWDSPVLSMYPIPIPVKRQVRTKIKGSQSQPPVALQKKRKVSTSTSSSNGSSSSSNNNSILGGIVGFLENGQMFVVLVCSPDDNSNSNSSDNNDNCTRSIKVGIYGKDNTEAKKQLHCNIKHFADSYIHSIVGLNLNASQRSKKAKNAPIGQKRKLDDGDNNHNNNHGDNDWGEVEVTSLSKDVKNRDSIVYCKHTLRISSIFTEAQKEQHQHQQQNGTTKSHYHHRQNKKQHHYYPSVNGVYSKDMGSIQLPHRIAHHQSKTNKNKDVHMAQLDSVHAALVYQQSYTNVWYTTILDTRTMKCTVNPFPLTRYNSLQSKNRKAPSSSRNTANNTDAVQIVNIGGLSNSILAVLTSDDILSVYDVRRAVILHELVVHSLVGKEQNDAGKKYRFGIGTHWVNGTIGIICNEVGVGASAGASPKKPNGQSTKTRNSNTISISYARVGIYDAYEKEEELVGITRKPFARNAYNLARVISSSVATTERKKLSTPHQNQVEVQPNMSDMINWFSPQEKHGKNNNNHSRSYGRTLAKFSKELEMHRPTSPLNDTSNTQSFFDLFKEAKDKLSELQKLPSTTKLLNGTHSTKSKQLSECDSKCTVLPQTLIDISISVAIDIILAQNSNQSDTISAAKVLVQCIETGMVSGRNHFSTSAVLNSEKNDETLRLLLLTLQAQDIVNDSFHWPLCLISSLLQHCKDGLTEQMLVSMVHFVLCYPSGKQFVGHWKNSAQESAWYNDSEAKVLEKRLKKALKEQVNVKPSSEDLQNLVKNLENKCAVSHQLFFIRKIVTHSKCNPALLRSALQSGLTQIDSGEVEVLIQALGKILRRSGKEQAKTKRIDSSQNISTCISQWLSAVVDTNMGTLLNMSNTKPVEQVKKEVTASISQTQAILSLKDLLSQMSEMIDGKKKDKKAAAMEVSPVPLYGIEPLIF